jgi:V/A-type H+-transporting ATPase subunit C
VVKTIKDMDFLFLTSIIRAREVRMLDVEKINRILDVSAFSDVTGTLTDCGYPDMSDMSMSEIFTVLENYRADVFREFSEYDNVLSLLDLFRMKYDYHNVKVLVKSSGIGVDANDLLYNSGRINAQKLYEAFLNELYEDIPTALTEAITTAAGVLSRTADPQLADIEIDKIYYNELASHAKQLRNGFINGYVQLQIDSANLRVLVRYARLGLSSDFLLNTLIPDGSTSIEELALAYDGSIPISFPGEYLADAARLGSEIMNGGSQTTFELACDNAVLQYVTNTKYISFGPAPIITYLAKLEWELTVIRMLLSGKHSNVPADIIRERLRECHV